MKDVEEVGAISSFSAGIQILMLIERAWNSQVLECKDANPFLTSPGMAVGSQSWIDPW